VHRQALHGPLQAGFAQEMDTDRMNRFIIISACSGGGKSTLLAEFQQRG
jgi:predicted ATPase